MSSVIVVVWLIIGSGLDFMHRRFHPRRNSGGWDFLSIAGFYAAAVFTASRALRSRTESSDTFQCLQEWVSSGLKTEVRNYVPEILLGFCVAFAWSVCTRLPVYRYYWMKYVRQNHDPYTDFVGQALDSKNYVILTMKSSKVYVGRLVKATLDPNEANRTLSVLVSLSGYRTESSHTIIFDKNYIDFHSQSTYQPIILPFNEINSLGMFTYEMHDEFVKSGATVIDFDGALRDDLPATLSETHQSRAASDDAASKPSSD